ncbi:hydroxypyruvate isomerase family protein [Shimia biformata]|uniref:hydroxypyruvate isomerase family protein n=1 Tax=Shimia biformata TaxID=1294299 RepID=UPI001EF1B258|nr:TIM barrel protein [Shimia biformata]
MRFVANLSMLFQELPFLDRFQAAADAGFTGVEVLFPYDIAAKDILHELNRTNLTLALINTPPPNWAGGERGFAATPGGQERFRHDLKRALRYAEVLGAEMVHIMSGAADGPEARQTMIDNLNWAVEHAPKQRLTIEPINRTDMPGYFLSDFDLAAEIITEISAPNLALQFDAYHAFMITGDVMGTWEKHKSLVGHIQIAGAPGRHEPVGGEIDYPGFFAKIDQDGYRGWVSAEYRPAKSTEAGLGWLPR